MNDSEPTTPTETPLETPQLPPETTETDEQMDVVPEELPVPAKRQRSLSPAFVRRRTIKPNLTASFVVEAVCALPHPCPTHSLAASACFTHLVTGSDDGYIRDYDIFTSLNGKALLSAPQRHHAGVVEGILKAPNLRCWWENPADDVPVPPGEELTLSPVLSMTMQGDALWAVSGTQQGHLNLFTVRHEPGHRFHTIKAAHSGPISSLCLDRDEVGVFSGGWDGYTVHWDLNTGKETRRFRAHGAQLSSVALRPEAPAQPSMSMDVDEEKPEEEPEANDDEDANSDFDPLFDDPDTEPAKKSKESSHGLAMPTKTENSARIPAAPRNAPPLLTADLYRQFSPDILMTTFVDGQVVLWDCRVNSPGTGVGRLWMNDKTPPWCISSCWSADGSQIYAGRRNGAIDVWDVRQLGKSGPSGTPRMLKTLRNPASSGVVSCVVAFPDNRHIACASNDNLRLWDVADGGETDGGTKRSGVPFKIIPGHHGGYISQMIIDPAGRFLVSASSNRGWYGDSTRTVFVHDIKTSKT
ncbi:WD40 repeat-like protein [Flagelloscypha sp. PMI_526]|nr:WD40 repeat-like protein [Flagelloscypha sp. PMI_526]